MIGRITWMMVRPSKGGAIASVLPIVAFGVVTALILIVVAGATTFWSWEDDTSIYKLSSAIAVALLIVPLLSLGGSAARLSARRRDDRLSTLRLLGATPGFVGAVTVLESTALAAAGAIAGVLGYFALVPLVALVPFRGEPLGIGSLLIHPVAGVAITVGIVVLAAVSAIVALRAVIVSPLGVRTRQDAPKMHWLRVVVAVLVVAVAATVPEVLRVDAILIVVIAVSGGLFALAMAVLNLIGPWVLRLVAKRQARRAQTADRLLSARIVLDAPKAAWRQVSGVSMTSFMAVFAGSGVALLAGLDGGGGSAQDIALFTDIRTGLIITLVISFLMVACSVGVNQAADVLDRREHYRSLHYLGMPPAQIHASRDRSVMSPLQIVAIGSSVVAAVISAPIIGMAVIVDPLSIVTIVASIAAGIGLVWLGLRSTRGLLEGALAAPEGATAAAR